MSRISGSAVHRVAWGTAFLLWLLFSPPLHARQRPTFPSADSCAACHIETYESWSRTFHALSAIDPVFVEAIERSEVGDSQGTRELCLMCHSPTTALTGDFDLNDPVSREGVTCSFCHSVTAIDLEARTGRFRNRPGRLVIDSPEDIKERHFEDHTIMLDAAFCAGCHEWVNRNGLRILSTYSEWKESPLAAEKVPCQECHMPKSPGDSADSSLSKAIGSGNLHFQMGGHSQNQLVSAAHLEVGAEVKEKEIHLDVAVTNAKAGHMLPTGIPNRKLKLLVDLYGREGELLERRTKVFSRVIANGEGRILEDITDQFLYGERVLADNRIAPRETRREKVVFHRPERRDFFLVEASLEYDIFTPYLVPPILNFKIVTKRLPLTPEEERKEGVTPLTLVLLVAVFLFVTAAATALLYRRGGGHKPGERKE
jgi:hypothetical protein